MNQNNLVSFLLGTAIGGAAIYFTLKHQDEIIDKIHELEDNLHFDHHDLIESAKEKFDSLSNGVHSTIDRFRGDSDKEAQIASLTQELAQLREELTALKA
jgi:polyhydroxyalkanoate synthesis regulator phasin